MDATTEAARVSSGEMGWDGEGRAAPPGFEDIPRLHGEALLRWALQLTGDRTTALDLVQDTYERALRRGQSDIPPERIRSWLFVIARNQFLDAYRARKRRRVVSTEEVLLAIELPTEPEDDGPWAGLGLDDLRRAVDRLSAPLAQVYRMHAFDGLDYAAIAARLEIPVTTVGTRLLRARLRLRDLLSRPEAACSPLTRRRRSRPARKIDGLRAAA
jgi:RNA polymerase sigma-70 factor (ECF subfamily)